MHAQTQLTRLCCTHTHTVLVLTQREVFVLTQSCIYVHAAPSWHASGKAQNAPQLLSLLSRG